MTKKELNWTTNTNKLPKSNQNTQMTAEHISTLIILYCRISMLHWSQNNNTKNLEMNCFHPTKLTLNTIFIQILDGEKLIFQSQITLKYICVFDIP